MPAKRLKPARQQLPTRPVEAGWVTPGPDVAGVPAELTEGEELSSLLGRWKIIQIRKGHRWSTDDLLTGFVAKHAPALPPPATHVDLGCGIGSVLLMMLFSFPALHSVGVEAQPMSASMARRSVVFNGCADRAEVVDGDLRTFDSKGRKFDLVTGTPPYFAVRGPVDAAVPMYGSLPSFAQSAPARFEMRGGLEDYVAAGSRLVAAAGRVVVCEGDLDRQEPTRRVVAAAAACGLAVLETVLVVGKAGKFPLFAVHVLAPPPPPPSAAASKIRSFVVRGSDGKRTQEYNAMCADMGIPPYVEQQ